MKDATSSFSSPEPSDSEAANGTYTVNSNVVATDGEADGKPVYRVDMTVEVRPSDGEEYYTILVDGSGLFVPVDDSLSGDDLEAAIFSNGSASLYSYICEAVSFVTRDAILGEVNLPTIGFSAIAD